MSTPLPCRDPSIVRIDDGWVVQCGQGAVLAGPFATNAEAWRVLDRLERKPVSPAEDKVDWLWSLSTGGGNL
jgi:hypothetical protein